MSQNDYILYKIEKCRRKLLSLIDKNIYLTDTEIVSISQELDKHLNAYNQMICLDNSHSEYVL